MSAVTDLVLGTASSATKKALLPWIALASILALGTTGAAGMYGGYEIATARLAREQHKLDQAYADASNAQKEALKQAVQRGNEAGAIFLAELRGMRVVNTTINKEVQKEVQKLIYTDCNLPDSGVDLLQRHVDEVNLRLLESDKK
jgi:hypothetical protein